MNIYKYSKCRNEGQEMGEYETNIYPNLKVETQIRRELSGALQKSKNNNRKW